MEKYKKIIYALLASLFFVGLGVSMSWAYYTPHLIGLLLIVISILITYFFYKKSYKTTAKDQYIKPEQLSLGLGLIFLDVAYNLLFSNRFGSFDEGIIWSGISIIFLNILGTKLLRLEDNIIKFATYFIFISIVTFSIIYAGMGKLFGSGDSNAFYNLFTSLVTSIVSPILNFILPTTVSNNIINFNGFYIGVGYGCSGIESLAIFFSAVSAFYFYQPKRELKKFFKYFLIGGLTLYIMNIIRIMLIILIGYYFGLGWMMFFHTHLGWVMFVLGMLVFCYFAIDDLNLE